MRLGASIAEAWGIEVGQDTECYGFFRAEGELWCIPMDRVRSSGITPIEELLELVDAHEGEIEIPTLRGLPSLKEIVAPDRLIRFFVRWAPSAKSKRFDLALSMKDASRLGRTPAETEVQVVTWKGWLVVMMKSRYETAFKESW